MNVKFLTILISSVSFIHGLQAMDDDEELKTALALSLRQQAPERHALPVLHLPAPRAAVANNVPDLDEEDFQAALALSLQDQIPAAAAARPTAPVLRIPAPGAHVANNAPLEDRELGAVLAETQRVFDEQQRHRAPANAEADILDRSKIAHAREKLAQRRRELNELHEEFQAAAKKEMDERTRDEFRSKFKAILLIHCLDGEENTLKEIDLIDKSFAEAVESGVFETMSDFEAAYKHYLEHRLQVRLSFANGNLALVTLIRQDEAMEAQLIREDFRQDIQYVQEREKAAKVKASDDLSQIANARAAYGNAVTEALGEFLRKNSKGNFDDFKIFLGSKKLPVSDYADILDDIWDLKDGINDSLIHQDAANAAEAQKKARELAAAQDEIDRDRIQAKARFLSRLENKNGTAEAAQAEKQVASSQAARKLAQEEAQKKAAEQDQKRAGLEIGAKAASPRDQELREARIRFLAQKEKETAEALETKKRAAQAEQARKLAAEEAQKKDREEAQKKAREEAEAKAATERAIQRAKEKFASDLAAKIAELRAAAKNEDKK